MNVLHIIAPHRLDDALLLQVMADYQNVALNQQHILCLFPSQCNVDITLPAERLPRPGAIQLRDRWLRILYKYMPDVICLHGEDDKTTARIAHWSTQRNFKVQRTKHLPNVTYKKDMTFMRVKVPRLLLYSTVVKKSIGKKQRNTVITNRILHTVLLLLKKYYDGDAYAFDDTDHELFASLSNSDWQTIAHIIHQQQLPPLESLLPQQYSLLSSFSSTPSTTVPGKPSNKKPLTEQLKQLQADIKSENVNLRQLAECYHTMFTLDEDETILIGEIKKQHRTVFLKDMETILSEMFALSEGFMLLPPRNCLKTNSMRKHIFNAITR